MNNNTSTGRYTGGLIAVVLLATVAAGACSSDGQSGVTTAVATPPPTTTPVTTTPATSIGAGADTLPAIDPAQLDPATQARLHVVFADVGGPNVDVFLNGAVAVNGGQPQANIGVGYVTAYLYLAPGTHHVAVVPTGQGLEQSLLPPLDVPMVAGHRYLAAFMGDADHTLTPLVIDETEAATKIGAVAGDPVTIFVNGLVGSTGLDYEWAGKLVNADVPYGGWGAGVYPAGGGHITVTAKSTSDTTTLIDEDNYAAPGDTVFGFFGPDFTSSDGIGYIDAPPTSELSLNDFLNAYDPDKVTGTSPDIPSFTTLLSAIETAGLTAMYEDPTPLLFLAPTDRAFATMPATERDALLADPAALADMLRSHTIAAYVPRGSLTATPGTGVFDRTFNNLLGETIKVGNDFAINGTGGGYSSTWLANGT